jgi:hypothetical protein
MHPDRTVNAVRNVSIGPKLHTAAATRLGARNVEEHQAEVEEVEASSTSRISRRLFSSARA